eukprot:TRINITY_DN44934_c0_g1_i1.p1 TRINITY_DN44934_c0_g1~~TRINITY_DN44934_c0_g1_i1.p1  ORF type:complete len:217 (+),score=72.92 TRINITY_DN44934_c0_g1_i1:41-652(+)
MAGRIVIALLALAHGAGAVAALPFFSGAWKLERTLWDTTEPGAARLRRQSVERLNLTEAGDQRLEGELSGRPEGPLRLVISGGASAAEGSLLLESAEGASEEDEEFVQGDVLLKFRFAFDRASEHVAVAQGAFAAGSRREGSYTLLVEPGRFVLQLLRADGTETWLATADRDKPAPLTTQLLPTLVIVALFTGLSTYRRLTGA